MASRLIPEIQAALSGLDDHMLLIMPALRALPQEEKTKQSVAFSLGLAMRLCTFGLGPAGQMHPQEVQATAMAIMETLNDLEADLCRSLKTSEN